MTQHCQLEISNFEISLQLFVELRISSDSKVSTESQEIHQLLELVSVLISRPPLPFVLLFSLLFCLLTIIFSLSPASGNSLEN
jgi:hypothetical protein